MNDYRLDPEEFIEFAKKIVKGVESEATFRRIMSGCYQAPKLFVWEYAKKRLGKGLKEIAREHGEGEKEGIGFRIMVAEFGRELVANEEFLYQSRVAADHCFLKSSCIQQTRMVTCDREEANNVINICEELVAEIKKKLKI